MCKYVLVSRGADVPPSLDARSLSPPAVTLLASGLGRDAAARTSGRVSVGPRAPRRATRLTQIFLTVLAVVLLGFVWVLLTASAVTTLDRSIKSASACGSLLPICAMS
jgi:hypothetical protein